MTFTFEEYMGAIAFLMGLVGAVMYIRTILLGLTTPHLYTWLVFTILTTIGFFAQLTDNAGPGSWMMAITAISCGTIAVLSLKYGEKNITKSDKIALIASLFAILPWLLTEDPLLSVILISVIDGVAMYPTLRKSWHRPDQENLKTFAIANVKSVIGIMALNHISVTTALYPLSIVIINTALITLCLYRRQVLRTA